MFHIIKSYMNPISFLMNVSSFLISNKTYSIPLLSAGFYLGSYYLAKTKYKYYLHPSEYYDDVPRFISYVNSTIHASTISVFNGLYLLDLIDKSLLNLVYLYGM